MQDNISLDKKLYESQKNEGWKNIRDNIIDEYFRK